MTQKARAMMCPHFLSQGARPSPQNVLRLWNHSISSRNHPYLAYGRKEWKRPEGEGFFGERNWIVMAFPLPLTYESQWDGGGGGVPPSCQPEREGLKGDSLEAPRGPVWIWHMPKKAKSERLWPWGWRSRGEGQGSALSLMTRTRKWWVFPRAEWTHRRKTA